MSTILKALRRLEEERSAQSQRPLREEVTRGSASANSRLGRWPLWAALLGLGLAVGVGALAFWVLDRAPEPAEPTELAAAGSAQPAAKPAPAAKRRGKPRATKRAGQRSSPSPAAAPAAASEHELPAAALASKVELVKRPPAQPRIAASETAEPSVSEGTGSAQPRPMDPAEIPGRHKRPFSRSSQSPSATAASVALSTEAPEPPGRLPAPAGTQEAARSRVATAEPVPGASGRTPAPGETEPRAEQPREAVSEPLVVAVAPEPESTAPEPTAAPGVKPAREAEGRASAAEPTHAQAAADRSSSEPAESSAVTPQGSEPDGAASSEIVRAEIPGLRVERTVWHPIAERRVALIEFDRNAERREIREGDAVGPLVVSRIEPSGVVFVHDGVEVRRRIGE